MSCDTGPDNPIAHAGDPATSQAAAEAAKESGRRVLNMELTLAIVQKYPGKTAGELWAEHTPEGFRGKLKELQELRRRLTDLKAAGRIEQGEARECRVRHTWCLTWYRVSTVGGLGGLRKCSTEEDLAQLAAEHQAFAE